MNEEYSATGAAACLEWNSPAAGPAESMPLGNGSSGINLWVTADGTIRVYLAMTGAYSENARLLKIGRIAVRFDPPLATERLSQVLDAAAGEIRITGTDPGADPAAGDPSGLTVCVRFDPHDPVVRLHYDSATARRVVVECEPWRVAAREIPRDAGASAEIHSAYGLSGAPDPVVVTPDDVHEGLHGAIAWCHHNRTSVWRRNMELQGLASLCEEGSDPLLGLTFGAHVSGAGLVSDGPTRLSSSRAATTGRINVRMHLMRADDTAQWLEAVRSLCASDRPADGASVRRVWSAFDARSFIRIAGTPEAHAVNAAYRYQRYLLSWAARGKYPIKFNGSLFTVDWGLEGECHDPDYRRWGGHFWFQNTRLSYWPMLVAGDRHDMDSLFAFYLRLIPLAQARTRLYFGHGGAFFPETLTPWGTYAEDNYGWDRRGRHCSYVENRYIRHYHQGALELIAMALDRYAFEPEERFLMDTLVPLVRAIVPFYDEHYPRENGRIRFYPAQSLETWHDAADPTPEIAGLLWVLPRILELPAAAVGDDLLERARRMLGELPPLPMDERPGGKRIAAAAEIYEEKRNMENPELYAVFPYRLFAQTAATLRNLPGATGQEAERLEIARRTYAARLHPGLPGWCQDGIQAAYLGLAGEAKRVVLERVNGVCEKARFPAFWGPNFDWIPDQDHGAVINMTLQAMLLQYDRSEILLFPAWPEEWDVHFRLHAPMRTVVEAEYAAGALRTLEVTPEARRADVVLPDWMPVR